MVGVSAVLVLDLRGNMCKQLLGEVQVSLQQRVVQQQWAHTHCAQPSHLHTLNMLWYHKSKDFFSQVCFMILFM